VKREISEDDPVEGQRVTDQLDKIWVKYTQNDPPYGLRDPSIDERRVLFEISAPAAGGRALPARARGGGVRPSR
jgi:hypothetical protein